MNHFAVVEVEGPFIAELLISFVSCRDVIMDDPANVPSMASLNSSRQSFQVSNSGLFQGESGDLTPL